jgi:hypothetical protein
MTAHHVIQDRGNNTLTVTIENNQSTEANVVFIDRTHDIAILEVPRNEATSHYRFGANSYSTRDYYIYGHPLSSENDILTHATFAGFRDIFEQDAIILNGYVAPGMSGGPVLDEHGRVIGMLITRATEPLPFPPGARFGIPLCGMVKVEYLVAALDEVDNLSHDGWRFPVDPMGNLL